MVGELKAEDGDEAKCLRQAANASHTCLVLHEQLAKLAAKDGPPIVAFISIGPQVKVFITYKFGKAGDAPYVCCSLTSTYRFPKLPHQLADNFIHFSECLVIWSGHARNLFHAIQLRCIVDKLSFWALRICCNICLLSILAQILA